MKVEKSTKIMFRFVCMFLIAIIVSYIADSFHSFFDDTFCRGYPCINGGFQHSPTWHWGYRRILLCLLGVIMFIVNICVCLSEAIDD